jgi:LuxR family maltose regulon positive regulatory protein
MIPPLRSEIIPRPRLIEKINAGLDRKMTLISAPAGFGKTTLLSDWAGQSGRPVGWLSLDQGDNDPTLFLRYLFSAFSRIRPSLDHLLSEVSAPGPRSRHEHLLTALVNEVAEGKRPLSIVLDDYHVIHNESVHDLVLFLLENRPEALHLILSTRSDPPWPMARLRSRLELVELRAGDLRFHPEEIVHFLRESMNLELSPEEVSMLETRTEGWIAGLQMAALSIQGRDDVSSFIKSLSGRHRYIMDYLLEEVLQLQSFEVQEFLLKTSILERISAPLSNYLLGREDGVELLDQVEIANLFLIPLDDERHWYRYHNLFAELLRNHLYQQDPDMMAHLHHKASKWYEQNGLLADAVAHAFEAEDFERAAQLVEGKAISMMDHGALATFLLWVQTMPAEVVRVRPWLSISYAWALVNTAQLEALEPALRNVTLGLEGAEKGSERRHIQGHISAIRSYAAELRGSLDEANTLAQEALELLPKEDRKTRCFAATRYGVTFRLLGRHHEATRAFRTAIRLSRMTGDCHVAVNALGDLAGLQRVMGNLHDAVKSCHEALEIAEENFRRTGRWLPVTGHPYMRLSQLMYEWNELSQALRYAGEAIDLCRGGGLQEYLVDSLVFKAMALQALGELEPSLETIMEAKEEALLLSPWYKEILEPYEALIRLHQGDPEHALRLVDESEFIRHDKGNVEYMTNKMVHSQALIAIGLHGASSKLREALGEIDELRRNFELQNANLYFVNVLAQQSIALQALGQQDEAEKTILQALGIGKRQQFVRTFVDHGKPMLDLLKQVGKKGMETEYVDKLCRAMRSDAVIQIELQAKPTINLLDPLSPREMEVLRLLSTNQSVNEIADELIVAVSTIRSHIKSIYSKLDVHSRLEAMDRAREWKLLSRM